MWTYVLSSLFLVIIGFKVFVKRKTLSIEAVPSARAHIHKHTHTHARTHARTHAHTHTRTHERTQAGTRARTHARTHTESYAGKYVLLTLFDPFCLCGFSDLRRKIRIVNLIWPFVCSFFVCVCLFLGLFLWSFFPQSYAGKYVLLTLFDPLLFFAIVRWEVRIINLICHPVFFVLFFCSRTLGRTYC